MNVAAAQIVQCCTIIVITVARHETVATVSLVGTISTVAVAITATIKRNALTTIALKLVDVTRETCKQQQGST